MHEDLDRRREELFAEVLDHTRIPVEVSPRLIDCLERMHAPMSAYTHGADEASAGLVLPIEH